MLASSAVLIKNFLKLLKVLKRQESTVVNLRIFVRMAINSILVILNRCYHVLISISNAKRGI